MSSLGALAGLRWLALLLALGAAVIGSGCSARVGGSTLQGSGATFPAPLYKRWFLDYYAHDPALRVNYTAIGSGAGIRQFTTGLVAFGASDAGISDKEQKKLPADYDGVLALPMTAGCIALSYNLPGLSAPVRLSRAVYTDIFLRKIVRWNDRRIAADNPGVRLPELAITVVSRADSSGTTFAFTTHMAAVAAALGRAWPPGIDKSVRFPDAISAQGNDGVAALIQLTPGAIGYIEFGFASLARLPMAALQNKHGSFVVPAADGRAGALALEGAEVPPDLQIKVPDPGAAEAYPIVTYTWLLVRKRYPDAATVAALRRVLLHCLEPAQQNVARELGYIPLPSQLVTTLRERIAQIRAQG